MSLKRLIVEMGTGNDLYGEDYTKAASRAVQDALHHSSLTLFKSLDINPDSMIIEVIIGVEKPEEVNIETIASQIPYGTVEVKAIHGGLYLPDPENQIFTVVATAAVVASIDLPEERFSLSVD